ncbi:hypothetical protein EV126DRAFT_407761 [Verticillium dahliae]|nr:hypothetical protein EV126DRAFT_407761 [Verticillium dahliae]
MPACTTFTIGTSLIASQACVIHTAVEPGWLPAPDLFSVLRALSFASTSTSFTYILASFTCMLRSCGMTAQFRQQETRN